MFDKISSNAWSLTKPLKVFGVQVGCKMVVVKLSDQSLFIHSPVILNQMEISALKHIGEVKYVVAPNLSHYLYLKDFINHFPSAKCYGSWGLDKKCDDIHFEQLLTEGMSYPWSEDIQQLYIKGAPEVNEVVFFSEKDSLLILADLSFNIQHVSGLYNTIGHIINNSYKKFGPSRHCQLYVKDKKIFLESVRKILDWNFSKITMAHGDNVLSQGKEIFKQYWDSHI